MALDNRKEEEEVSIVTARYEQDKILITYPQFEEIEKDLSIEKINEQIKHSARLYLLTSFSSKLLV